jgi:hypothetical protein
MPGMTEGVSLLLTLKTVSIPIHLGPAWYIERIDAPIEVGDRCLGREGRRRWAPGRDRKRGAKGRECAHPEGPQGNSCLGGLASRAMTEVACRSIGPTGTERLGRVGRVSDGGPRTGRREERKRAYGTPGVENPHSRQ